MTCPNMPARGGVASTFLIVLAVFLSGCTSTAVPKSHLAEPAPRGGPFTIRDERASCGSSLSALSRGLAKGNQQCEPAGFLFELLPNLLSGREPNGRAEFWRACQAHDICYLTPGMVKAECDWQFLRNLRRECDRVSTNSVRWVCHGECNLAAQQYHLFASRTNTSLRSFAVARAEAAAVLAALPEVAIAGDSARQAETAALVGEACFWINRRGRCQVEHAAEWVAARLAGDKTGAVEWMEAKGIAMRGVGPGGDTGEAVESPTATLGEGATLGCTDQTPGSEPNRPWNLLTCP